MRALGQGYGYTEHDTIGTLLETNVTIITIEQCRKILLKNSTLTSVRRDLIKGIPYGLNDTFLCAQGTQNEKVSKS